LSDYINISSNLIYIDSDSLPTLNKSATLSIYNLSFDNPKVLKDGEECPSSICSGLNYENGVLTFNVTGFTSYSAAETAIDNSGGNSDDVSDVGGSSGGGGGMSIQNCMSEWNCSEWYECIDSVQARTCTDIKKCTVASGKPVETRGCKATNYSDNILNLDEDSTDCSGKDCDPRDSWLSSITGNIGLNLESIGYSITGISIAIAASLVGLFLVFRTFSSGKSNQHRYKKSKQKIKLFKRKAICVSPHKTKKFKMEELFSVPKIISYESGKKGKFKINFKKR